MTGVSVAELAAAVNQLVEAANAREQDLFNWQEGTPTGGPYADGRYALRDYLGTVRYFKSPQRLQFEIDQLINDASTGFASATAAQTAAEAAADDSALSATAAAGSASAAATSATQADTFRQQAASSEANALTHRNNAAGSATAAGNHAADALTHRNAAETAANNSASSATASAASAANAAASAAQAALFDVANYYLKAEVDTLLAGKAASGHGHTSLAMSGTLSVDGLASFGKSTGAAADGEVHFNTTNYYNFLRFRRNGSVYGSIIGYYGGGLFMDFTSHVFRGTDGTERFRVHTDGNVGIDTNTPTARLDINGNTLRLRTARTPASAAAAGNAGDICWDSSYVYVCTATNTWKRAALSSW